MIIEHEESVVFEEGAFLGDQLIGGLWTTFRNAIPRLQAKELDEVFNLIMVSDPDSLLPSQVSTVLVDEQLDVPMKKQTVYVVMTTNIIALLKRLGVEVFEDIAGEDKLGELYKLANFFFILEEYEDLIGLKGLLESYDIPPVNRLLQAMTVYMGEDEDLSEIECLVEDVSEVALKAIKDALFNPEDIESTPKPIQDRIIANKLLIEGTLAYRHVTNNGQLGGSVLNFCNFFKGDLEALTDDPTEANLIQYAKEMIGIYLISEINNEWLKDKLSQRLFNVITDMNALIKVEQLIEQVVLP